MSASGIASMCHVDGSNQNKGALPALPSLPLPAPKYGHNEEKASSRAEAIFQRDRPRAKGAQGGLRERQRDSLL